MYDGCASTRKEYIKLLRLNSIIRLGVAKIMKSVKGKMNGGVRPALWVRLDQ